MLFTTPEQFIALAAILVGGWMIGFACAPSPRKWQRRAHRQGERFKAAYLDLVDRLRAAQQRGAALSAEADALRADLADARAGLSPAPPAPPAPPPAAQSAPDTATR